LLAVVAVVAGRTRWPNVAVVAITDDIKPSSKDVENVPDRHPLTS
jgi:hypothetical protein